MGERLLEHVRRAGKGTIDVADRHLPIELDIRSPLVVQQRLRLEGILDRHHGRERLVFDVDELGSVLSDVAIDGGHDGDRLANVAHLVRGDREHGRNLEAKVDRDRERSRELERLNAGEHRDNTGQFLRTARVDGPHQRVCMWAPNDRQVKRALRLDVVGELTAAGQEPKILLAPDAPSDPLARRRCQLFRSGHAGFPFTIAMAGGMKASRPARTLDCPGLRLRRLSLFGAFSDYVVFVA